jgi:hypothetical protein
MTNEWSADVTNDPRYDYDLCVEVSHRGEHRMTIRRAPTGELVIEMYPAPSKVEVPADWLMSILTRAERELPALEASSTK